MQQSEYLTYLKREIRNANVLAVLVALWQPSVIYALVKFLGFSSRASSCSVLKRALASRRHSQCRDEDAGFVVKEIRERKGIFG